jgi:gas vesicle protein
MPLEANVFIMSNHTPQKESLADFFMGLLLGFFTGAVLAVLLSPRSGEQTREKARELPKSVKTDWSNPYGKARTFIGKQQASLEGTVDAVNHFLEARRLAKAKRKEDKTSAPEFSEN